MSFNMFGIDGHYQDDGNGVYWVGPSENELLYVKASKRQDIKSAFELDVTVSGTYTTSEGWILNARRSDLDNLQNLYTYLTAQGATQVSVRLYDNTMVTMSLTRLQAICLELAGFGLSLYQKKWVKLAEVDAATTVEDVQAIVW